MVTDLRERNVCSVQSLCVISLQKRNKTFKDFLKQIYAKNLSWQLRPFLSVSNKKLRSFGNHKCSPKIALFEDDRVIAINVQSATGISSKWAIKSVS